eukprot:4339101-Pleurochrysis_carterae.AAC.1
MAFMHAVMQQASMQVPPNPFLQAFPHAFSPQLFQLPQLLPAGWPSMCYPPATPAGNAGQSANSSSTSPSLLAIQARVNYQNKRERELNDAQALFEYHLEKKEKRA